ncbi:MAG: HD domain-containing protein [Acidobacteriota bacterium]
MEIKEVKVFLEPQFGYLAKSNGEQLWAHHFAVWNVFRKMGRFIPSLDDREKELLELSCLIHDIGKLREESQKFFRGEGENPRDHKSTIEEVRKYLNKEDLKGILPFELTESDIKFIYDTIKPHHSLSDSDIKEISTDSAGIFTELVRYADWLASMESISPETINKVRQYCDELFDLTYFEVSRFPSPTTFHFLRNIFKEYQSLGWELLLTFDNAALFIGKGLSYPEKEKIIESISKAFFDKSLGIQSAYPKAFTKALLGGLSKVFPAQFMIAANHKNEIIGNLGDVSRKGVQFLRILYDIFSLDSSEFSKIKKNLPKWNTIGACLGTSGHPKAKRQWEKAFGENPPASINTNTLSHLLNILTVKDVIPDEFIADKKYLDDKLSNLKPDNLFILLHKIAEDYEKKMSGSQEMLDYLNSVLSMEEEKDFRKIASEIFERYKTYKKTTDALKGVCERCQCPVSMEAQPALKYKRGVGYGFSQIISKPAGSRATCPMCAYDNMVLREGLGDRNLRIYTRISSKVPELISLYPELDDLVAKVKSGVSAPYQISKLEERKEFRNIPFVKRLKIPIPPEKYRSDTKEILSSEQGILFDIQTLSAKETKNFSPKDMRVRYEPLYHFLNLLGFETSLGTEEQVGLFGESILSTEEEYYKSLSVILLASILEKGQKKYIMAKDLLEKSPSVAITYTSETRGKTNRLKLSPELMERFYEFIYKSGLVIYKTMGGEYKMDNLLNDAVFFANGIPKFCWTQDEWQKWFKSMSKHSIGKPVSQSLNEMLLGRSFDEAFAKFLSHIRENIAKEKSGEAKTDIKELEEFVREAKGIFQRYYDLKKDNITQFIRVKNSLLSAIYVFKRYENLQEVLK